MSIILSKIQYQFLILQTSSIPSVWPVEVIFSEIWPFIYGNSNINYLSEIQYQFLILHTSSISSVWSVKVIFSEIWPFI